MVVILGGGVGAVGAVGAEGAEGQDLGSRVHGSRFRA